MHTRYSLFVILVSIWLCFTVGCGYVGNLQTEVYLVIAFISYSAPAFTLKTKPVTIVPI